MRGLLALQVLLVLGAALGCVALGAVALDAVVILPASARAAAPWALAGVGVTTLLAGALLGVRLTPLRVSRRLERFRPALGTILTNAVQLSAARAQAPVGEVLRRQAVKLGQERSRTAAVWPMVRRGALVCGAGLGLAAVLWALGPLLLPRVFSAVLPRFLDPHGDHPPYSRLSLRTTLSERDVLYGAQCEVHAHIAGGTVEKLFLVAESSGERSRTVMFRRPDGSYLQTLTNLRTPTTVWVTDGRARSLRRTIGIRYTPQIRLVQVETDFPDYTGLKTRTQKLTKPELSLPERTRVRFRVASNRPLARGTIRLTPLLGGEPRTMPLACVQERENMVAGGFEVREAVAFALQVEDVEGLASREPHKGRITILPDRRPRLHVLEPGQRAVATPQTRVPVDIRVQDDYGVASALWFRSFNESMDRSAAMDLALQQGGRRAEARNAFDLGDLGVHPGDRIDYFFEAVDNYPGGPNVCTSRMYSIEIISKEEYEAILRQQAARNALFEDYRTLDDFLRRLNEHAQTLRDKAAALRGAGGDSPAQRDALRAELDRLAEALNRYCKHLEKTLRSPVLFDIESIMRQELESQRDPLARLRSLLDEMRGDRDQLPGAQDFEDMASALAGLAQGSERRIGEPVRHIASVARLLAAAQSFTHLALEQKRIARMSRRFQEHEGALSRVQQMELQELAAAQARVRDGLQEFMERVPELLAAVPEDRHYDRLRESTNRFLAAVREAGIQPDLDTAAQRYAALDGPGGYPPCRSAAEKMMALVKQCNEMDLTAMGEEALCLCFQPVLQQSMGDSLSQILSAMQGASGGVGYGLYGEGVSLYGPDVQLAGQQQGRGRGRPAPASAPGRASAAPDAADPDLPDTGEAPRVRLQRTAKFPLRYRRLVGEYFRAIAESLEESGAQ